MTFRTLVELLKMEIEIRHSAVSREGFARGAVLAAEFLKGKNGVLGMEDMLKF